MICRAGEVLRSIRSDEGDPSHRQARVNDCLCKCSARCACTVLHARLQFAEEKCAQQISGLGCGQDAIAEFPSRVITHQLLLHLLLSGAHRHKDGTQRKHGAHYIFTHTHVQVLITEQYLRGW